MWKFQESIKKELDVPEVLMKISWNFRGSWFLTLEFPPATRARSPLGQGSQEKSKNLSEDQEKWGKLDIFGKSQGKVKEESFYSCKIFNFNKNIICTQKCVKLNCLWQYDISCIMLLYLHPVLRWFDIANPLYLN